MSRPTPNRSAIKTLGDPPRRGPGLQPVAGPVVAAVRALTVRHGAWTIFYDPPPVPVRTMDYGFAHDDFDASWEGEEDGYVSNGLAGRGASVEDCLAQIADIEAERQEAA